ncbi:MAG: Teichoic acid export ATP-binding protein TagH [uncultured Rubrobacteraceae bacterium]|uniref:Teichoic acid export ATP-binding protein TagH n=1 Tax=uncultured Rubrobacteraceae bacterium TaxID=349277 RepID=A0A6J4R9E1_9ACTN|nr:MAG: Teichoic acid export ATP-binding protein TagH [uncultured Rubrobacteraceae bacterium]
MTPVVSLKGVGKRYRISSSRSSWIKDLFRPGKSSAHEFWAVEDIDLDIEPGATLGILGRNGAGKSTLLKMISGVSRPTAGEVRVEGRLAAIFSTGAGFNPEFTGRDNVMLNGLILGIERDEMLARFDDIAAFADIGEFMDQPIKTYSSGMKSRLGFAVAVNVEADVLVLDEALSAGDAAFKKKALQRMYDLRDSGTTVLFVSHSLGMVQRFCTEAVLLHKGHLVASGDPKEVVDSYRELLENSEDGKKSRQNEKERQLEYAVDHEDEEDTPSYGGGASASPANGIEPRQPTGEATILGAEFLDGDGRPARSAASGSTVTVRVHLQYLREEESSAVTLVLRDASGQPLFSKSTGDGAVPLGPRSRGERAAVDFTFGVPLRPGSYAVDAAVGSPRGGGTCLGRAQTASTLEVTPPEDGHPVRGLVDLPARVRVLDAAERQPPA